VLADGSGARSTTIILGTGFHVTDPPTARLVRGRGGRTLAEAGASGIQAYRGATMSDLPELFKIIGPNTASGTSNDHMIESHLR